MDKQKPKYLIDDHRTVSDFSDKKLLKSLKQAFTMRDKMIARTCGAYPMDPILEAARRWMADNE